MDVSDIGALVRQPADAHVGYRRAEEDVRALVAGLAMRTC